MFRQGSLAPFVVAASATALGLGLLVPTSSSAAEGPAAAAPAFSPTLTYVDCPADEKLPVDP